MDIYIIKVSMIDGGLICTPNVCEIDRSNSKSLIVWMLDDSLKDAKFNDLDSNGKGFQWIKNGNDELPPTGIFKKKNIDRQKRHISIKDHHLPRKESDGEWTYLLRISMRRKVYTTDPIDRPPGKKGRRVLRRKPPVIINK